jgi:hypothetical protein
MPTIRVLTNLAKTDPQPPPKVQLMDLEEYLRGVALHEMSPSWPIEALKAQAVAARTYAMATLSPLGKPRHASDADICTTEHCQAWSSDASPATDAAVMSTAGQYLKYGDKIATAYFFGHCGGRTKSVAEVWGGNAPWCQPVDCLTSSPPPPLGHSIGMCQDGARLMAERGYDYEMILHHYYTDVTIAIVGVRVPPTQLGYNSQYVLMPQTAGPDVWAMLAPYALQFRVTSGFSHDDALRVHGDKHIITLLGSAGQSWSVSVELEQFLRQVAPTSVTVERVEGNTLAEVTAKLQNCIAKDDRWAFRG